jgi:hypothetical protein
MIVVLEIAFSISSFNLNSSAIKKTNEPSSVRPWIQTPIPLKKITDNESGSVIIQLIVAS